MERVYILVIIAVLSGISIFLLARDIDLNREKYLISKESTKKVKLFSRQAMIYCILMIIITVLIGVLFCTIYKESALWIVLKRMALLSLLWPIAYIDAKTYRIPNLFVVCGLVYRAIILLLELVFGNKYIWFEFRGEAIAALALLLAAVLCAVVIKNSIGFGDMKLFVLMGMMLGLDGIWSAIFLSLLVSFVVSVYLLATKKKTRKDAIPFGPALVIGTYLSIGLTGM